MHPIFNPIGYIFIGSVVIIVLYQVYYYRFGGKNNATVIELKDLLSSNPAIQTVVQEHKQQLDKTRTQEKQQLIDDLANGDAYILPPRYFAMPHYMKLILVIAVVGLICYLIFQGYTHTESLFESCETIFDLQVMFVQELGLLAISVLCLLLIFKQHISYFVHKNQPHHKIKAHWFNEKIVYKHKSNLDKPTFANDYLPMAFPLVLLMLWTSLPDVRSDLQKLDVNSANQFYHQQCLEKQQKTK